MTCSRLSKQDSATIHVSSTNAQHYDSSTMAISLVDDETSCVIHGSKFLKMMNNHEMESIMNRVENKERFELVRSFGDERYVYTCKYTNFIKQTRGTVFCKNLQTELNSDIFKEILRVTRGLSYRIKLSSLGELGQVKKY